MSIQLHQLGQSVQVIADETALFVKSISGSVDWTRRETWPQDALDVPGGWRTAIELEQILELGYGDIYNGFARVPYDRFEELERELPVRTTTDWTTPSPFLLKIDRHSDIGYRDFKYKYQFLLAGRAVHLERHGYYARRSGSSQVFRFDTQTYNLVEAMDGFNSLPEDGKNPHESWLVFSKVKGCARDVGAELDLTLQKNDVVIPSSIGLDMFEDADGSLTFLPTCPELSAQEFKQIFERNPGAEKVYSIDRPGQGKVRLILSEGQHEVLRRMKRVRKVGGELKEQLERDPVQVFDGVADQVVLPYSDRVTGIGDFKPNPVPRPATDEATMAELWRQQIQPAAGAPPDNSLSPPNPDREGGPDSPRDGAPGAPFGSSEEPKSGESKPGETGRSDYPIPVSGKKLLLIETNEDALKHTVRLESGKEGLQPISELPFQQPQAFRNDFKLHPHQENGVQWLQTCVQSPGRQGVVLADDMGVGKTIQILTFLALCIESGKFPDLTNTVPPFRPILIIVPLILLDTRSWEREMERFFANEGSVFWPVLPLHGADLWKFRLDGTDGREVELGKPVLDLSRLQRNRVVITNYETVKNYQHSFAYFKDGKSLWSIIISDEAQEYKVPSSRISHTMKALKADFQIACTGTPVENRLLDLWNICDAIQPGLLSSAKDFVDRFEKHADERNQTQQLAELKRTLLFQRSDAFLLRRNKTDVVNLPPKHIEKLSCEMSEEEIRLHQALLSELRAENKASKFLGVLHSFAELSQHPALLTGEGEDQSPTDLIAGSSKLRAVIQQLHNIRSRREKAIIFARHRGMQSILAKVLAAEFGLSVRIINGDTKMKASPSRTGGAKTRSGILEEFKAKPGFNMIILSPFVAGIGLTITEANHVIHYGRWWNPAVESQATDRAYRIGQEREVFVYVPILHDQSGEIPMTFDERLDALMQRKYRLAEDFLRPLAPEDTITSELLTELRGQPLEKGIASSG